MSSRAIFTIKKLDSDGKVVLDRNVSTADLDIYKNGSSFSTTIYSNGDGSYWFEPSGSGQYSVRRNGQVQDEFKDIYIVDDDVLTKGNVDSITVEIDGNGNLAIVNGTTLLRTTDVVDSLSSTATTAPLSANQGNALSASVASKEPADTTILKEADIVNNLTTGGTNKVQSAESIKLNLAGTNYIGTATDYNEALLILDRLVSRLRIQGLIKSYFQFGYATPFSQASGTMSIGDYGGTDAPVNQGIHLNTVCDVDEGIIIPEDGAITAIGLTFNVTSYTDVDGGANFLRPWVVINDAFASTYALDKEITRTGVDDAYSTNVSFPVTRGDNLKIVLQNYQSGSSSDTWVIDDLSLTVEFES